MNEILAILTAVINSLWQAAVVAAIVWIALRYWPRTNAATRYAIWWATLAVVLILPAAPHWIAAMRHHAVSTAAKSAVNLTPAPAVPNRVELFVIPPAPRRAARWPIALLAIWAAILAWRLYQIGRSYLYLRSVKRRAIVSPIPLPNIPRRADLLISGDIASPMALGFLKPAVVLPDSLLEELSDAEREHVLLHEAAHLVRRDDWANLATRFLAGALALHPVAIWILWRIDPEREIACDEWVVSRTGAARPYAASLARLFDLLHGRGNQMLASGIFGRGSTIGDRIEALLRRGRTFTTRASAPAVLASAMTLGGLMLAGSFAPRWIAFAQQEPRPSFEVASIKPDGPSDKPGTMHVEPGRLNLAEVTVKMVVQQAYAISGYRLYGGASWLDSERYSIAAKAADNAGGLTLDQMRPMLQAMLKDRFRLAVHREEKELPVYRLVVSRNGPRLRESAVSGAPQSRMGTGQITDEKANMDTLASQLGQQLGRFVSNQTGLRGDFNFHVEWAPDPGQNQGGESDTPPPAGVDGPSIFTALQDQLGLKLESAKGPVEVLVIDHVEKPDAN